MDKIIITGGTQLKGHVRISGSKNAALPILAATLLSSEPITISNLPGLRDIKTMLDVLSVLGTKFESKLSDLWIDNSNLNNCEAPYELVRTMRASVLVMGPLLARFGYARVSLPGGCAIGLRPINLHLEGLERLGAKVKLSEGIVEVSTSGLKGNEIYLDIPSVGATENLMMAACLAEGKTIIDNAAKEPEIIDLANFLNKIGAQIQGAGKDQIIINGVKQLQGTTHSVIPDRIEAGTFMLATAITKGEVTIERVIPEHLHSLILKLKEVGVLIKENETEILVKSSGELTSTNIRTMTYPGFPTDMQAQFMSLMTVASGISVIMEAVFENRFMHVSELCRMGADIKVDGHTAVIRGVQRLNGANVMATDLRASAALIIAGLVAEEQTHIHRVYHLDRGYEQIEKKLTGLGAEIKRVKE